ncbi:MAG: PilZ domain-containing protein [Desulfobacterales bacterium]|nr:PilZ domain-containing protein [Desulfobacterales bacterium]MCP4159172.1 PilZ domain-containing protein [Deltaproteobacteria bacterium]
MEDLSMADGLKIKMDIYDIIEKMTVLEQVELLKKLRGFKDRKKKRSDVEIDVVFSVKGIDYRGQANNISFDGLFIQTDMVFDKGDEIAVKLASLDSSMDTKVKGIIARITEYGVGVSIIRK